MLFLRLLKMAMVSLQSEASSVTAAECVQLPQPNDERQQEGLAGDNSLLDPKDTAVIPNPSPSQDEADSNIVTWDGPNDPTNPRNWSVKYRWFVTILVSINNFSA
jgi:hypothetical protein